MIATGIYELRAWKIVSDGWIVWKLKRLVRMQLKGTELIAALEDMAVL